MKYKIAKEIFAWLKPVLILLVSAAITTFLITVMFGGFVVVPTESMEPTIAAGTIGCLNNKAYLKEPPMRGDIIIFDSAEESKTLCKRIVGLPNETISIKAGITYINGEQLDESYSVDDSLVYFDEVKIPADNYFVMGDNRPHSYDSRYWDNPFIEETQIRGKFVNSHIHFFLLESNVETTQQ